MKTAAMVTAAMLMAAGANAGTPGMNLLWGDCSLGAGHVNETSACDSDLGLPYKLVVSVEPDGLLDNVNGAQGIIDVIPEGSTMPDFWHLETGGCRQGKLAADGLVGDANPPYSCLQPWRQVGNPSFAANFNYPYVPYQGRITWIVAVPGAVTMDSTVLSEWYLIALNILRGGTSTCTGCSIPAQLTLSTIRITRPVADPRGDVWIYTGPNLTVTWQGQATPVVNRTWGQVKSLFR